MIDVRGLQVGSLVLDRNKRLVQIRDIDGIGVVTGFTLLGEKVASDTDDLQPIPITVGVLEQMGFVNTFADLNIEGYSVPDELEDESLEYPGWELKGKMQGCIVKGAEDAFFYADNVEQYNPFFFRVESVHSLQDLIWQLEHVWLTLTPPIS